MSRRRPLCPSFVEARANRDSLSASRSIVQNCHSIILVDAKKVNIVVAIIDDCRFEPEGPKAGFAQVARNNKYKVISRPRRNHALSALSDINPSLPYSNNNSRGDD